MGKRWGKADFAELKALEQRIDKLEKTDFDRLCRELANELAARLLAKVKKRTPGWELYQKTCTTTKNHCNRYRRKREKAEIFKPRSGYLSTVLGGVYRRHLAGRLDDPAHCSARE